MTTLPSAKYRITVGCFDTAKAGNTAVFDFKAGDVEFSITSAGNNLSEVSYDFMLMSDEDLIWKASGTDTKSIDYIYIQRMGDATTEVKKYDYTVNAVDDDGNLLKELSAGTEDEGTKAKIAYSTYILKDGVLYKSSVTNKEYNYSFELLIADQVENITYKVTGLSDVVYLEEGENIEGLKPCTSANTGIRSSNSASAYAEEDIEFVKLSAGVYQLTACIFDSAKNPDSHWIFKAGEEQIADLHCETVNYVELTSEAFSISADNTPVYIAKGGNGDRGIDFIFIQKVGDIVAPTSQAVTIGTGGWATMVAAADLDFSDILGLEAYTATLSGDKVELTKVDNVQAGTGVVLKGNVDTYDIPYATDASVTAKGDLKGEAVDGVAAITSYKFYGLTVRDGKACFALVESGNIPAGKAYLQVDAASARDIFTIGGDATAIKAVDAVTENGVVYNVSGQRVAQPSKGLYIVNGKKVIK